MSVPEHSLNRGFLGAKCDKIQRDGADRQSNKHDTAPWAQRFVHSLKGSRSSACFEDYVSPPPVAQFINNAPQIFLRNIYRSNRTQGSREVKFRLLDVTGSNPVRVANKPNRLVTRILRRILKGQ